MPATTSVRFEGATEPGALDGFRFSCSCGETAKFSIRQMAYDHATAHVVFCGGR